MLHAGPLYSAICAADATGAVAAIASARSEADLRLRTRQGRTALHLAAAAGLPEPCIQLLECPFFHQHNDVDLEGRSALHLAAEAGRGEVCYVLLEHPQFKMVNAEDFQGHSTLHLSALKGHLRASEVLLTHPKFTVEAARQRDGMTALHLAAKGGHPDLCMLLLRFPVFAHQLQQPDHFGRTVLGLHGEESEVADKAAWPSAAQLALRTQQLRDIMKLSALETQAPPQPPRPNQEHLAKLAKDCARLVAWTSKAPDFTEAPPSVSTEPPIEEVSIIPHDEGSPQRAALARRKLAEEEVHRLEALWSLKAQLEATRQGGALPVRPALDPATLKSAAEPSTRGHPAELPRSSQSEKPEKQENAEDAKETLEPPTEPSTRGHPAELPRSSQSEKPKKQEENAEDAKETLEPPTEPSTRGHPAELPRSSQSEKPEKQENAEDAKETLEPPTEPSTRGHPELPRSSQKREIGDAKAKRAARRRPQQAFVPAHFKALPTESQEPQAEPQAESQAPKEPKAAPKRKAKAAKDVKPPKSTIAGVGAMHFRV